MKTKIVYFCLIVVLLASCAKAITPGEAASGRYKKCRALR